MLRRIRLILAVASVMGALALFGSSVEVDGVLIALGLLLGSAALLMSHRHVISQLWVRGTLWAHLIVFAGAAGVAKGADAAAASGSTVLLAAAFLLLGRWGLTSDTPSAGFKPASFRGTFLVGAVISIALAQWVSAGAAAALIDGEVEVVWLGLSVGAIFASLAGLYRLELWGLLLKAFIDVGFVIVTGLLMSAELHPVTAAFFGLAIVQFALSLPVWVSVLRHRPPTRSVSGHVVSAVAALGAIGIAAWSVLVNADAIAAVWLRLG